MSTQLISEAAGVRSRTAKIRLIAALGPLTMLAGVVWAFLQPYRITFLHPHGEGFWWLLVQPPLLVIGVGIFFALFLAPGLIEDLEAEAEER
jgi:hypothetical protein